MDQSILSKDFKEFIELLNKNNVQYLVVGGYAVALHGYVRTTKDLDFWISSTFENAEKIVIVLREFGFNSLDIKVEDFIRKGSVIQLGYPPYRIDILNEIDGVDFEDCFNKKLVIKIDGIDVNLIDLESLKKNKGSTGRLQDRADLEEL